MEHTLAATQQTVPHNFTAHALVNRVLRSQELAHYDVPYERDEFATAPFAIYLSISSPSQATLQDTPTRLLA